MLNCFQMLIDLEDQTSMKKVKVNHTSFRVRCESKNHIVMTSSTGNEKSSYLWMCIRLWHSVALPGLIMQDSELQGRCRSYKNDRLDSLPSSGGMLPLNPQPTRILERKNEQESFSSLLLSRLVNILQLLDNEFGSHNLQFLQFHQIPNGMGDWSIQICIIGQFPAGKKPNQNTRMITRNRKLNWTMQKH